MAQITILHADRDAADAVRVAVCVAGLKRDDGSPLEQTVVVLQPGGAKDFLVQANAYLSITAVPLDPAVLQERATQRLARAQAMEAEAAQKLHAAEVLVSQAAERERKAAEKLAAAEDQLQAAQAAGQPADEPIRTEPLAADTSLPKGAVVVEPVAMPAATPDTN